MRPRIHDLLEIDVERFLQANVWEHAWVAECLRQTPFVVVRRGPISSHEIPVGIRGTYRNERCAGTCHPSLVREILTPQKLLGRAAAATYPSRRASDIPALQALALLTERWSTLEFPWGPGGSVGFELATGRPTATSRSDLDAVIYADRPMTTAEARRLRDDARERPAPVDIRVETPTCGSLWWNTRIEAPPPFSCAPHRVHP